VEGPCWLPCCSNSLSSFAVRFQRMWVVIVAEREGVKMLGSASTAATHHCSRLLLDPMHLCYRRHLVDVPASLARLWHCSCMHKCLGNQQHLEASIKHTGSICSIHSQSLYLRCCLCAAGGILCMRRHLQRACGLCRNCSRKQGRYSTWCHFANRSGEVTCCVCATGGIVWVCWHLQCACGLAAVRTYV